MTLFCSIYVFILQDFGDCISKTEYFERTGLTMFPESLNLARLPQFYATLEKQRVSLETNYRSLLLLPMPLYLLSIISAITYAGGHRDAQDRIWRSVNSGLTEGTVLSKWESVLERTSLEKQMNLLPLESRTNSKSTYLPTSSARYDGWFDLCIIVSFHYLTTISRKS